MNYKLIALDLDGTALNSNNLVTDVTKRAVLWAREKGVRVVVATGRGPSEAAMFAERLGADELLVATGGAVLARGVHCIQRVSMPSAVCREAMRLIESALVRTVAYAGSEVLISPEDLRSFGQVKTEGGYCTNEGFLAARRVVDSVRDTVCAEGLALDKIFARSQDYSVLAGIRQALVGVNGLHLTSSAPDNFEVLAPGADKGRMLATLAAHYGTDLAHTIAIGDSENDKEMLAAVGMPVAMGNAPEPVRKLCRFVTDTNDRDGVSAAIYTLLGD